MRNQFLNIGLILILITFSIICCKRNENKSVSIELTKMIERQKDLIQNELINFEVEQIKGFYEVIHKLGELPIMFKNVKGMPKEEYSALVEDFESHIEYFYQMIPNRNWKLKSEVMKAIDELKTQQGLEIAYAKANYIVHFTLLDLQNHFKDDLIVYNDIKFHCIQHSDYVEIIPEFIDVYSYGLMTLENNTVTNHPNGFFVDKNYFNKKDSLLISYQWVPNSNNVLQVEKYIPNTVKPTN